MKNRKILALLFVVLAITISSCQGKMKGCVEGLMEEGYTYDEAWEACEDASLDSQIR